MAYEPNDIVLGNTAYAGNVNVSMDSLAGYNRICSAYTGGVYRWGWGAKGNAESGSNSGSDWFLSNYSDAGVFQGFSIIAKRSTGFVGIGGSGTLPADGQGQLQVLGSGGGGSPASSGTTDPNQVVCIKEGSVGLRFGFYAAGGAWIQNSLFSDFSANYAISLNPNGGSVTVPTAPQFDNGNHAASTAFVQLALGNTQAASIYGSGQTIATAQFGQFLQYNGTSNATFTLPTPVGNGGLGFPVIWNNSAYTLTLSIPAGTFLGPYGTATATLVIPPNTSSEFIYSDGYNYYTAAGAGAISRASSLASSGYQKLPSGLIIQWGTFTTSSSGFTNWTFPVAFPNGVYQVFGTPQQNGANAYVAQPNLGSATTSYIPIASTNCAASPVYVAQTVSLFAIGH